MELFKFKCHQCGAENDLLTQTQAVKGLTSKIEAETKESYQKQLDEFRQNANEIRRKELEYLEKEKKWSEAELTIKLEYQRQLASERVEIEKKVRETATFENVELKTKLDQLTQQLNASQRLASQGSVQLQGEVQEVIIKDRLTKEYPLDLVQGVPKGVRGADAVMIVRSSGRDAGSLIFESKRTANFDQKWITKLKEDQRASRCDIAVLVTQAMPKGVSNFQHIDGVWVSDFKSFEALVGVLRMQVLEADRIRQEQLKRGESLNGLQTYLNSPACRNNVNSYMSSVAKLWDAIDKDEKINAKSIAARRVDLKQLHGFWLAHATDLESHGVLWGSEVAVKCLPHPAPLSLTSKAVAAH